jgi:cytochrome c oxidase accessory protein FixG
MCPYARFQGAMFDRDTLIIAYDPMRGEPRGPRKRGLASVLERARGLLDAATAYDYVFRATRHPSAADNRLHAAGTIQLAGAGAEAPPLPKFAPEELGDCIDCTICVQVCPTGIDIRNGLQYECIACGACIDACNDVMGKMGYPSGLIRYTTHNAIEGGKVRVLRPRIVVYGLLLAALAAAWAWGVTTRSPLIVDVLRDRNALYRGGADGRIENGYTLKLVNKADQARAFTVEVGSRTSGIVIEGLEQPVRADAEEVLSLPLVLSAPATVRGRQDVVFTIRSEDGAVSETIDSTFFGPM